MTTIIQIFLVLFTITSLTKSTSATSIDCLQKCITDHDTCIHSATKIHEIRTCSDKIKQCRTSCVVRRKRTLHPRHQAISREELSQQSLRHQCMQTCKADFKGCNKKAVGSELFICFRNYRNQCRTKCSIYKISGSKKKRELRKKFQLMERHIRGAKYNGTANIIKAHHINYLSKFIPNVVDYAFVSMKTLCAWPTCEREKIQSRDPFKSFLLI